MKKMYFVLLVVMLLGITSNVKTLAAEEVETVDYMVTKEYVMARALEAFPEYSSKICGEKVPVISANLSRCVDGNRITFSETRWLTEDEVVSYTEYANGLSTYAYGIVAGQTPTYEYDMGAGVVIHSINMWLLCPSSEDTFIVNDVFFIVRESAPGSITNMGTVYMPESSIPGFGVPIADWAYLGGCVQGTETQPAYIEYSATFEVDFYIAESYVPIYFTGILRLEVGPGYYDVSAN